MCRNQVFTVRSNHGVTLATRQRNRKLEILGNQAGQIYRIVSFCTTILKAMIKSMNDWIIK